MAKQIQIKGTIEKIVRVAGKAEAQMVVTIPVSLSVEVPLGAVSMTVESLQSALFGKNEPMKMGKAK